MIRKLLFILALMTASTVRAQEVLTPDTTLHLPSLNNLGQMHYINQWPGTFSFAGFNNWSLHEGMNMSLSASVFAGFGKYAPKGAGFAQTVSGMYAVPLSDKLSLAAGIYLLNADWGGLNLRDTGLSGVMGYKFNERWEGYLYGQKSLSQPNMAWPMFGMHELGDRIGASLKYNISPSVFIQVSFEDRKNPTPHPNPLPRPQPHPHP